MRTERWRWWVAGVLGLACASGANAPPALEGPVSGGDLLADPPRAEAPAEPTPGFLHEAFRPRGEAGAVVRSAKAPPAPIAESPTSDRPAGNAQWVPGYWAWDTARGDFVWVSGAWRVAPAGMIWVSGRWVRDAQGWSRVPGVWSPRQNGTAGRDPAVVRTAKVVPSWRTAGPPPAAPADVPGDAPGPDFFYVPGGFVPQGDRVSWSPGFWAREQPGWDWVPARWLRRPDGWDFREGYWARDPSDPAAPADRPEGTIASRSRDDDAPNDLPPAIVESSPFNPDAAARPDSAPAATASPSRPGGAADPVAGAEDAARAANAPPPAVYPPPGPYTVIRPPVVIVPRYRRPPRYYDPRGVVPPFARRLIDRFAP